MRGSNDLREGGSDPRQPSAFVGQTVMPGYRNNLAFHPTRGLTPQSEMSESDDQQPLRTEEGPRAHACEPRADANNQNEFAVARALASPILQASSA